MDEKNYFVKNWKDLKKLVNSTNHNKDTIILCGFINELRNKDGTVTSDTRTLIFKKVSVEHLKDDYKTETYHF